MLQVPLLQPIIEMGAEPMDGMPFSRSCRRGTADTAQFGTKCSGCYLKIPPTRPPPPGIHSREPAVVLDATLKIGIEAYLRYQALPGPWRVFG
jgi:hypothetical protein